MTEDQEAERLVLRHDRTACKTDWIHALSDFAAAGPFPPVFAYERVERCLHALKVSQRRLDAFDALYAG